MIIAPLITILISLISLDSLNAQIFLPKSSLFCQGLVDYELATYSDYELTFDYLNSVDSNLYRIFNGIEPYRAALPLQGDFLWKYFCALAYPKLDAEKNVIKACASTCNELLYDKTIALNRTLFRINRIDLLPDQCVTLPEFIKDIVGKEVNATYSESANCLKFDALNAVPVYPHRTECPLPYVKVSDAALEATKKLMPRHSCRLRNCVGKCCVPCPFNRRFYPESTIEPRKTLLVAFSYISAFFMLYIFTTYSILPNKRLHPPMFFLSAALIWQGASLVGLGSVRRIQCADDFINSTMSNNILCGIQGLLALFGNLATLTWGCLLILNLHLQVVWEKELYHGFTISIVQFVCWGIPFSLTLIAGSHKAIEFSWLNSCHVSVSDGGEAFFIIPAAVIVSLAAIFHFFTFLYIAKIVVRDKFKPNNPENLAADPDNTVTNPPHVLTRSRSNSLSSRPESTKFSYPAYVILQQQQYQRRKQSLTPPNSMDALPPALYSPILPSSAAESVSGSPISINTPSHWANQRLCVQENLNNNTKATSESYVKKENPQPYVYSDNPNAPPKAIKLPETTAVKLLQSIKLQWRPMLLAFLFLTIFSAYWLLSFQSQKKINNDMWDNRKHLFHNNTQFHKKGNERKQLHWISGWANCIFLNNQANTFDEVARVQTLCLDAFKDNIPKYSELTLSSSLSNTFGFWMLLIFGLNIKAWRNYFNQKYEEHVQNEVQGTMSHLESSDLTSKRSSTVDPRASTLLLFSRAERSERSLGKYSFKDSSNLLSLYGKDDEAEDDEEKRNSIQSFESDFLPVPVKTPRPVYSLRK